MGGGKQGRRHIAWNMFLRPRLDTQSFPFKPLPNPSTPPTPHYANCNCALLGGQMPLPRSDCVYKTFRAVNFKRNAAINRTAKTQNPEAAKGRREIETERQRETTDPGPSMLRRVSGKRAMYRTGPARILCLPYTTRPNPLPYPSTLYSLPICFSCPAQVNFAELCENLHVPDFFDTSVLLFGTLNIQRLIYSRHTHNTYTLVSAYIAHV